ncbi:MAG: glycosyltransferase family 4 protein [Caulobacterales bacterium]|nr:glycosyltransferase family 4 protein [Caulobacterales bacterium]
MSVSVISLPRDFVLLQVVPELEAGGVERTAVDISRAVVEAGATSLIASAGGRMEMELTAHGGELIRMPVQSKNPVTIAANLGRLYRLIRARKVGLVHVRSRAPALSALPAARLAGVPALTTYHGVYNAKSALKRAYNGVMTKGRHVIANSDFTRRHVLETYGLDPRQVTAVARGSDLRWFDPDSVTEERRQKARAYFGLAADDKRTVFLLAGRLTRWKGQLLAVEAAQRLRDVGRRDFVLVMVGDDQGRLGYRAEIERAVASADLDDCVAVAGHFTDMPAAWLVSDVAVVPSLDPEAFGRTAVEPQLMGRPVVVAAHGAPVDTVVDDETGWLFRPGDAEDLARRMAQALDAGSERRRQMGEVGQARARELYSQEAMVEGTFGVYAQVLEEVWAQG